MLRCGCSPTPGDPNDERRSLGRPRAEQVVFTAPFTLIEAVFAVPESSPLVASRDVDRSGSRIGVKLGSAYDLYLSRTLQHAELVRGDEGTVVFAGQGLEVAAGLRTPISGFAADHGLRVLEPAFQQICHAIALPRTTDSRVVDAVDGVLAELKASGFVADSLRRSGRDDAIVAAGPVRR